MANAAATPGEKISYFQVLPASEASSIITGAENKDSINRGMQRVYEFINEKTDTGQLVTFDMLEKHFADKNYNLRAIIDYFTEGVKSKKRNIPLVHMHIFLKLVANKALQPVVLYGCSQTPLILQRLCDKYNAASCEEISKRAESFRQSKYKTAEEQKSYLAKLIISKAFEKSYALSFLEDEINSFTEARQRAHEIFDLAIRPVFEKSKDDKGIYYRDIDPQFKRFGLKPVVLFSDKKLRLERYRFLVRDVFMGDILPAFHDGDLSSEAEELKRMMQEGFEMPERIAALAQKAFDRLIKANSEGELSSGTMQTLQILLEIFAVKTSISRLVESETREKVNSYSDRIKDSDDLFSFKPSEQVSKFLVENLQNHPSLISSEYPINSKIVHFFLHRQNEDLVISKLQQAVNDLQHGRSTMNANELQIKIEVLSRMVGNKITFKSLKHTFLKSRIGRFRRFINLLLNMFRKKSSQPLEEKMWSKIVKGTQAEIEKIYQQEKATEARRLEKEKRQKLKDIVKEKEQETKDQGMARDTTPDEQALTPDDKETERVKNLAAELPKMWWSFLENISLEHYRPPMKEAVAELLEKKPDELSAYLKKNSSIFKQQGVGYILLKRSAEQVYVNRNFLKRWGQLLCDIYDAIDKYEFQNKLRNELGRERMDFSHDLASFLHGKGFKEKNAPALLKEYEAVLANPAGKTAGQLSVARFITRLMQSVESARS